MKMYKVLLFLIYLIEVQLIYNLVLISVQQSDLVIHIYTFPYSSVMVHHRIFNLVPCAVQ